MKFASSTIKTKTKTKRSWESVRTMFTAPQDGRWAGIPQKVRTINSARAHELQRTSH